MENVKGFSVKVDQFDLDYVKAAIETVDLIELILIRLNVENSISKLNSILQALIERTKHCSKWHKYSDVPSPNSIKDVKSVIKYWEGACDTIIFMKNQWEERSDYQPFLAILREKRDFYSLHIVSDAISPLSVIVSRFFFIHWEKSPLERELAGEEREEDVLSPVLREVLQILLEEDSV